MKRRGLMIYILLFFAAALVCPWIGSESLPLSELPRLFDGRPDTASEIFWFQRLPRVGLALLAGAALAVVGAAFQVLFRNPLVEPFTLGVSGGASLGAFIALSLPSLWVAWGPFSSVQIFALAGAAASLFLIYSLARHPMGLSIYTLLLAGITISVICGGAILLLTYLASPNVLVTFQRWLMGGIDISGYRELGAILPLLLPSLGLLFFHSRDLNHIALGEDMALGHGVDVKSVQRNVFIGGGIATAMVVSVVGPIGFVGLIIPHIVRRLSGFDQRRVLTASFFLGGAVLAFCDALARRLLAPVELPVGIITAVFGGPVFIHLLVSRRWK
jgi:iron complex transport system permease protein